MKDSTELKAGLTKPKTGVHFEEVKADATHNYLRRLQENKDRQAYNDAKANGGGKQYTQDMLDKYREPRENEPVVEEVKAEVEKPVVKTESKKGK